MMWQYCEPCKKGYDANKEYHELCGLVEDPPTERGFLMLPKKIWLVVKENWYFLSDGVFGTAMHVEPNQEPDKFPAYISWETANEMTAQARKDALEEAAAMHEDLAYRLRGKACEIRASE